MSQQQPARVRELLASERFGLLATLSARRGGWPFASLAPFALWTHGEPLLLLSDLAEHARNLRADPRASLLVADRASHDDPLAGPRVTLLGTVRPVTDAADEARRRFVSRHPEASQYATLGDFHVWALDVDEARFVNGFGDMGWLRGEQLQLALAE